MIISVPKSWNLSQSSLVSRWQLTRRSSSQLQRPFISTFFWDLELFLDDDRLVVGGTEDDSSGHGELIPGDERSPGLQMSPSSSSKSLTLTGVSTEDDVTLLSSSQMSMSFSQSLSEKSSVSEPRCELDSFDLFSAEGWWWLWLLLLWL